jgi:hypothetical protein
VSPRAGWRVALIQPPWAAIMARLRASPRPSHRPSWCTRMAQARATRPVEARAALLHGHRHGSWGWRGGAHPQQAIPVGSSALAPRYHLWSQHARLAWTRRRKRQGICPSAMGVRGGVHQSVGPLSSRVRRPKPLRQEACMDSTVMCGTPPAAPRQGGLQGHRWQPPYYDELMASVPQWQRCASSPGGGQERETTTAPEKKAWYAVEARTTPCAGSLAVVCVRSRGGLALSAGMVSSYCKREGR